MILQFVTRALSEGDHAPTTFCKSAWAATIQYFSEHVRVTGGTLKDAVRYTGAWEHRVPTEIAAAAAAAV